MHPSQFNFPTKERHALLEFTPTERSRWIETHTESMHSFEHDCRLLSYRVLKADADPEMPIFFGYDSVRSEYFVSASVPILVRKLITILEYERNLFSESQTYVEALRKVHCPQKKQKLFASTLRMFFSAELSLMEDNQNDGDAHKEDITEALAILSGTPRAAHHAA